MSKQKHDSVEQIRDILFGEQSKKIEQRFALLEQAINQQFDDIKQQLEENARLMAKNVQKVERNQNKGFDDVHQQQEQQISQLETSLSNKIVDTEAGILNELQAKLEQINNRLTNKQNLSELLKQLAEKIAE